MKSRRLTLTTIGLPIRTELRLKSLLTIVNMTTVDQWLFSDGNDADLAICEPTSALTQLAVKRSQLTGSPRCVSLVKDEGQAIENTLTIRDPIRPADFVTLLNAVSDSLQQAEQPIEKTDQSTSAKNSTDFFSTATSLGKLIKKIRAAIYFAPR